MSKIKFLTNKELTSVAKDVLSEGGTIVTAYVGEGANELLNKKYKYQLICDLENMGTNPMAVEKLFNLGRGIISNLYKCNRLHAKVYFSKKGVVVSSGNFSKPGILQGKGALTEVGIFLPVDNPEYKLIFNWIGKIKKVKIGKSYDWKSLVEKYKRYKNAVRKFEEPTTNQVADGLLDLLVTLEENSDLGLVLWFADSKADDADKGIDLKNDEATVFGKWCEKFDFTIDEDFKEGISFLSKQKNRAMIDKETFLIADELSEVANMVPQRINGYFEPSKGYLSVGFIILNRNISVNLTKEEYKSLKKSANKFNKTERDKCWYFNNLTAIDVVNDCIRRRVK